MDAVGCRLLDAGAARRPFPPAWRLAALVAVVALAGFLVGEQVALSASRARVEARPGPPPATSGDAARRQAEADGIDVDRAIDAVRHHITPDAGRPGVLTVEDDVYRAVFEAHGFGVGAPGAEPWFGLSLTAVGRAGRVSAADVGPWVGEANMASRSVAAGVSERVTARKGELEWDVVLSSPPPGQGDLRIDATVTGGRPERAGDAWRWQDGGGGRVDLGELVVVDATGAELHRALPAIDGDRLRLEVPASVLDGAAFPLTVDPVIGPAHPVSPARIERPRESGPVDVAFDGTNYLVLLQTNDWPSAVRMDRDGHLLDRTPIRINHRYGALATGVAFDGTNFLVVWMIGGLGADVFGTRVSRAGEVLDPDGFPIATGPGITQTNPDVSFDGTDYLVAWNEQPGLQPAYVAAIRIDPLGHAVDPAPRTFDHGGSSVRLALEFGGHDHLAVWWDEPNGIRAARLGPDGTLLDPGVLQLSTTADVAGFDVAFDGENWQVVWSQRSDPTASYDVVGTRVSLSGAVLDPAPHPISATGANETSPFAGPSGNEVAVSWTDDRAEGDVYAAWVNRSGTVTDPIPVSAGPGVRHAGPLAEGGDRLLATLDGVEGGGCCFAQAVRLTRDRRLLDPSPLLLSYRGNTQVNPRVAFDGTNYLVAWGDDRDGTLNRSSVYVARVSRSGVSLDPAGIRVGTAGGETTNVGDVAFDGTNFVVVFDTITLDTPEADQDLFVTLVSPGGQLVTPVPVPVATGPESDLRARLSTDGTNTLVVWERWQVGIFAARITPSGDVLDPGGVTVSPGETANFPAVAFDGTSYLVVYSRLAPDQGGDGSDLVARRITPALEMLDPTALAIDMGPGNHGSPDVEWGGTNYLVAWIRVPVCCDYLVEATRVSSDGVVLAPGPFQLSPVDDEQWDPAIAALDGWFLVTWRRQPQADFSEADTMGARIHETGAVLDPEGFLIADHAVASDAVTGTDGQWRVAYRSLYDPTTGVERVFLRNVAPK